MDRNGDAKKTKGGVWGGRVKEGERMVIYDLFVPSSTWGSL